MQVVSLFERVRALQTELPHLRQRVALLADRKEEVVRDVLEPLSAVSMLLEEIEVATSDIAVDRTAQAAQ